MKESRLYVYKLICMFLPEMSFYRLKNRLLRWCGAKVGTGVRVCSSALISGNGNLSIGDNVWIAPRVIVRASPDSTVVIGDNCDIAPAVKIWSGTHSIAPIDSLRIASPGFSKDITIGNGCWIGMGSMILAGVSLGEKCVVGAGGGTFKVFRELFARWRYSLQNDKESK